MRGLKKSRQDRISGCRRRSGLTRQRPSDAIKEHIIPNVVSKEQVTYAYAEEADLLNVALFGMTARQWRDRNPDLNGNIRDYATLEQLVVISNMESINALLIQQQLNQRERLVQLNSVAISQMQSLVDNKKYCSNFYSRKIK